MEVVEVANNEENQNLRAIDGKQASKKKITRYYDKQ